MVVVKYIGKKILNIWKCSKCDYKLIKFTRRNEKSSDLNSLVNLIPEIKHKGNKIPDQILQSLELLQHRIHHSSSWILVGVGTAGFGESRSLPRPSVAGSHRSCVLSADFGDLYLPRQKFLLDPHLGEPEVVLGPARGTNLETRALQPREQEMK